jgi:hypothetical protein
MEDRAAPFLDQVRLRHGGPNRFVRLVAAPRPIHLLAVVQERKSEALRLLGGRHLLVVSGRNEDYNSLLFANL